MQIRSATTEVFTNGEIRLVDQTYAQKGKSTLELHELVDSE